MHVLKSHRVLHVLDFKLQMLHSDSSASSKLWLELVGLETISNQLYFNRNASFSFFFFSFPLQAMKGEKGIGGTVTTGDGLSEELTEEAFSK